MTKADLIAVLGGGTVLALVLVPLCLKLGAELDDRSVSVFATYPSPAGTFKVVVYDILGNATVGANTDVALVESSATVVSTTKGLPDWVGSSWKFFTADSNHGSAPCKQSGACPPVEVKWLSESELKLTYPPGSRVFLQLKQGDLGGHPFTVQYPKPRGK
jgi:hypothetical protein